MAGHGDKAKRYIGLLETARLNGDWNELPELIRKVTKHARDRKLLIETATLEHDIATRNSRNDVTVADDNAFIQKLEDFVKDARDITSEELLQARACLAWAAWTGKSANKDLLKPLPLGNIHAIFNDYGQKGSDSWTKICLIKAAYIQGSTLVQNGDQNEAFAVLDPAVDWIDLKSDIITTIAQLAYWCEQLLAQRALAADKSAPASTETLKAFRLWSAFATKSSDRSPNVYGNLSSAHIVRFLVWKRYYSVLSQALRESQNRSDGVTSRLKQTRELRSVESAYETELLRTQKFPKATESNVMIEEWVERAIQNWQILCGPEWRDSDLGEGGRNALTRNMLDILYRAASKTFQSTLILRRLFQVHKSLAEFELAYRCLDTYIELIERGRIRSLKLHEPDPSQDSDETVLLTISEGILGLCSFGRQDEARKAFGLSKKLDDWLLQLLPAVFPELRNEAPPENERTIDTRLSKAPSSRGMEIIHRAIGIAKAHWARWTPFNEKRSELQSDALGDLQTACESPDAELESMFAYALLLAETREIDAAIQCVKKALHKSSVVEGQTRSFTSERKVLPFWHLLALLLSSREEFETASRSCTAAFEQFSSSNVLFGGDHRITRNASMEKDMISDAVALVDDMECNELHRLIELQISHVALTELLDGTEPALKSSNDLLSLYSRLFARFNILSDAKQQQQSSDPPKSSAGTMKSFRGSIFSRKKQPILPIAQPSATTLNNSNQQNISSTARPVTHTGQAPTIQVTDENERQHSGKHGIPRHSHDESSLSPRKHVAKKLVRNHSKSRESQASAPASATNRLEPTAPFTTDLSTASESEKHTLLNGTTINSSIAEKHGDEPFAKQSVNEIPHNVASHDKIPPPTGHVDQPPKQDVRLPNVHSGTSATSPTPRFPKAVAQKHALMILNKVWLVIAALYRRGDMFEDAREAGEEASKAASRIEALTSVSNSAARALTDPSWGGGDKSSDEIWADVFYEKAELSLAITYRREAEGQAISSDNLREAVDLFEQCLMYFPNHTGGVVGLSNLLLDYYEKKIDLGRRIDDGRIHRNQTNKPPLIRADSLPESVNGTTTPAYDPLQPSSNSSTNEADLRKTPENLNRIAARDRAYGLLSTLTKLGSGWDDSEAWFALARAQELGGEIERAKGILWWCIDLENTRPIRSWQDIGCSGYVL